MSVANRAGRFVVYLEARDAEIDLCAATQDGCGDPDYAAHVVTTPTYALRIGSPATCLPNVTCVSSG